MNPRSTIDAVLAGDHARFTDLVRHFDAPVRRIVSREMRDPHALEEVVQEIWCRTFRQLARLQDVTRLEAWIGRIARNCVTDHFRDQRRRQRFVPLEDDAARPNRIEWVWDLVDRLDPSLRDVLSWRYREHLSYAEIGERAGVPVSTVRGRLFMAREALREHIERERGEA